jgi:hypothetical protein
MNFFVLHLVTIKNAHIRVQAYVIMMKFFQFLYLAQDLDHTIQTDIVKKFHYPNFTHST